MGLIDRFTRDGVSKVVWAGLMLGAIAGLVFAMIHGDAVVARERAAAQARAVAYVDQVLDPRVDASSSPVTGSDATSLRAASSGTSSRTGAWSAFGSGPRTARCFPRRRPTGSGRTPA